MTVPSLVNVMAISSIVLNGLFQSTFDFFSSYMTYNMHRGAGVMAKRIPKARLSFFLEQMTHVLTSLAMGGRS